MTVCAVFIIILRLSPAILRAIFAGKRKEKMPMNETPALEIHIKIKDTVSIQGDRSAVSVVSFSGEASSASFKGKVLSGAADTQIKRADGTKTLSARYILEGVDSEGNACKIFIENNGTDSAETDCGKPREV